MEKVAGIDAIAITGFCSMSSVWLFFCKGSLGLVGGLVGWSGKGRGCVCMCVCMCVCVCVVCWRKSVCGCHSGGVAVKVGVCVCGGCCVFDVSVFVGCTVAIDLGF